MLLACKYEVIFETHCSCEGCHMDSNCRPELQKVDCNILELGYHMVTARNDPETHIISVKLQGEELTKKEIKDHYHSFRDTVTYTLSIL